ncbi:hypothetical protein OCGS_2374 [Oceaniovalibus guishaninsula JLT2003]|uniref:Host specificity protein n=1 Tax=Oceaniovalibus guishaninsula JLT2003 TaxID=1231392 RepID=K2HAJ4_9RHOB|nr:glycoside hydrolase/phage tail family protein [Oceaniovalibus guishaninsula]EKE43642.1 hypothetical protein OCGS_2374 [Oceaniovalibus guishaninsula JLT2003]
MATLVLGAVGAAAGGALGGGVLGLSSVVIGRALGATLGRVVDQSLLGAGSEAVETGRVDRFRLTGAGEGTPIARLHGRVRVGGQVIWASRFLESSETQGGGKGAPSRPEVREYGYSVSLAIALCEGKVAGIGRIWADGREIGRDEVQLRLHPGDDRQQPDAKIEAVEGTGNVPAYRGLAYVVIEDLDLAPFGNRVPQFTFEVMRGEQAAPAGASPDLAAGVRAVAMMPGTGEYALATTRVRLEDRPGVSAYVNVNSPGGKTDFAASLDALGAELPRCGSVSLIVSWFGDDLRCGACKVVPKVEQTAFDGKEMPWTVSGLKRRDAATVPVRDGGVIYGGTPADASVVEAIAAMRAAGQAVMFYPFLLMEQGPGNGLADPWSDAAHQPELPWRGRITLSKAPGQAGSPDGTAAAAAEVASFFGTARVADFAVTGQRVRWTGGADDGYRRFILHYAHLCAAAGGVDSFCIGSEMRSLTQIRDAGGFPAVEAFRQLARDVRAILGPDVKIGYAADWSEYFGYRPQDGSGDVFFHLDPLWADPAIDFIGIDNYMPLADWRDGDDHADAGWGTVHNLDYLRANVAGGEGFDWYYGSAAEDAAQIRTPIADGAHGEDWVFRYKDLVGWWSNPHHDRPRGLRKATPTPWVPQSKPIWFTEIGCAAIDKGANEPNKFLDPKSSESGLPKYSSGRRDDLMQMQFLRASFDHWSDPANNPVSDVYGAPMVDVTRAHVWAWDARPYPYFPGNADLWSDADNYYRGHWITGRATNRALASVVREICAESGVRGIDVGRLYGLVRGYVQGDVQSARAALQPLMLAYGFDAVERAGTLVFRSRTGRAVAAIDAGQVAVSGETEGDVEHVRLPDAEKVGRLRLTYTDAGGSFETRSAEAVFPDERSFAVAASDLPLVLTQAEGRAITERWLAEARVARDRVRFALPPSRLGLGAGDVVTLGDSLWRIDHVEQAGLQLIEAVRTEPGLHEPSDTAESAMRLPRYAAPVPVLPVLLDLPLLRGTEAPHAPHVAAAARPWPGSVAVYGSATGSGYDLDATLPVSARIGVTQTPLHRAASGIWDRGPALRVRMIGGALQRIEDAALLAGANAMAIGGGADDIWEVFQFREAELVARDTFDLSMRLRGQAGTDGVMPDEWPAGSRVVLLNRAVRQIDLRPDARGLARHYRIGPAGRPLDDPAFVEEERAFAGAGLRPYAPVHLRVREAGGGLDVTWIRRTRIGGDSWLGLDVPLGEEDERYLVRIRRGGAILRQVETDRPAWHYGAADRAADGPGVRLEVAQVSTAYGPGPFGVRDLP